MVVGSVCDLARQVGSVSTQWSKIENSIPKSFLNQYQNLLYLIGLLKKCVINLKKVFFFLNDYIIQRLHGKTMSDFY